LEITRKNMLPAGKGLYRRSPHLGEAATAGGDRRDLKERAVADPVLIAVVISCAHAASRVVDALAQRIILRARRDLVQAASTLPPGAEVREQDRAGGTWQVRAGGDRRALR
jgi:hypothetical protein